MVVYVLKLNITDKVHGLEIRLLPVTLKAWVSGKNGWFSDHFSC